MLLAWSIAEVVAYPAFMFNASPAQVQNVRMETVNHDKRKQVKAGQHLIKLPEEQAKRIRGQNTKLR